MSPVPVAYSNMVSTTDNATDFIVAVASPAPGCH